MELSNKAQEFLIKLAALCREFNASISGCGCCGSPSIDIDDWSAADLSATADQVTLGRSWYEYNEDSSVKAHHIECLVTADGLVEHKDPP